MRVAIFGVGLTSTVMAIMIKTVYGLWVFCSDLVYVILFPQLLSVLYLPGTNTYGSLAAFFVGLTLRMLGGEPLIGMPVILQYPWFDEASGRQLFPFRTLCTAISLVTIVSVSQLSRVLFLGGSLPPRYDVFHCVVNLGKRSDQVSVAAERASELTNVGLAPVVCRTDLYTSSASPLVDQDGQEIDSSKWSVSLQQSDKFPSLFLFVVE